MTGLLPLPDPPPSRGGGAAGLLPLPSAPNAGLLPLPGADGQELLPLPSVPQAAAAPGGAPLAVANQAKRAAQRLRAEALLRLKSGAWTLADVLRAAHTPEGAALTRLRLVVVLTALGHPPAKARRILTHTQAVSGSPADNTGRLLVGWLFDARTGGSRLLALQDALHDHTRAPWFGYPWTPPPPPPVLGLDQVDGRLTTTAAAAGAVAG